MKRRNFLALIGLLGCKDELENMNISKKNWWISGEAAPVPYVDPYTSYTPSFTGFSTDPVVVAKYYNNNGMIHLWITPSAHGTSNAAGASFTFTLPVAAVGNQQCIVQRITDNGSSISSQSFMTAVGTTATVFRSTDAVTAFTASGNKSCVASFLYESENYSAHVPTFGGFSVSPTVTCRYYTIGKFCHLYLTTSAHGTSNATSVSSLTFTLPVAAASGYEQYLPATVIVNGGVREANPGLIHIASGASSATVYRNAGMATTWTGSGNKSFNCSITYQTA